MDMKNRFLIFLAILIFPREKQNTARNIKKSKQAFYKLLTICFRQIHKQPGKHIRR